MSQLTSRVVLTREDFILRNHRLHNVPVLPGVAFLDIVFRMLVAEGADHERAVIRNVVFAEAVVAAEDADREIRCTIDAPVDGVRTITASSRWLRDGVASSPWRKNLTAELVERDDPPAPDVDLDALRAAAVRVGEIDELYARARREGIEHGPAMRCRGELYFGQASLLARLSLEVPDDDLEARFHLHPAKLDASTLAGFGLTEVSGTQPFIPMFIREFRAPRPIVGTTYLHVPSPEVLAPSGEVITSDYALYDERGRFLAGFTGLACKRIRHPELITGLLPSSESPRPTLAEPTGPTPDGSADLAGLTDRLRAMVANRLDRPASSIRTDTGFYDLGLDSLALLGLGTELEGLVGHPLFPTLLFEYSDIDSLAAHLADSGEVVLPPADGGPAPKGTTVLLASRWSAAAAPAADPSGVIVVRSDQVDRFDAGAGGDIALLVSDQDLVDTWRAMWRLATVLAAGRGAGPVRLTAVCPDAEPDSPVLAALGAFARTITAETPEVFCRVVADDGAGGRPVEGLLTIAGDDPTEVEIRIRDGRRLVRRWAPVPAPDAPPPLRRHGAYLISGGSGAIGRLLTEHLVVRYQARVLLVGRRPADEQLRDRLRDWNQRGGDVRHVVADVSDPAGAQAAAAAARTAFGHLDGVLHGAGVRRDSVYLRKTVDEFAEVAGPKAFGAVHLDAATAADELDFFAVFSSLSASIANPGQSDYAAANAFAEAVAQRRAAWGDRAGRSVAIGWPYWADGGMTVSDEVIRRAASERGVLPLPTTDAMTVLEQALAAGEARLVVLHGDRDMVASLLPEAPVSQPPPVRVVDPDDHDTETGIAVIGLSGRYPQAPDLGAFWRNLAEGRDSITEVPVDRWDHSELFDPVKGRAGRSYGKWGGFLDGVDQFCPAFFGISRREAELMDPQERLFLTTCWHTLEDAGYPPDALRSQAVGVFAGVMWNHYQLLSDDRTGVAPTATHSAVANRVSFCLDLTGPSMAVDTACSSSLTAVHLAVGALQRGECTLALAGGVNAIVHPQKYLQLADGQWLSTDGRCRAFGRGGTGYVPGEGVGAVLLKPLAQARRDGDHIYGVIRGSAMNHGGRTGGVTVPSPAAQAQVIEAAVRRAGWDPATIGYVEAHGTGTSLGDPIEVEGLRRALDAAWPDGRRCHIGSVKSNVGHLEGAAGIAGLTKVLLQLEHGRIAPSLHSAELNPRIDFGQTPFVVPQRLLDWPRWDGQPRRAGVSAFGAGGAGCHLLVEEADAAQPARCVDQGPWLFVLSAKDRAVLDKQARAMAAHVRSTVGDHCRPEVLSQLALILGVSPEAIDPASTIGDLGIDPTDLTLLRDRLGNGPGRPGLSLTDTVADLAPPAGESLADIAYTLQVGRTPMAHRLAVVAADAVGLAAALDHFIDGAAPGDGEFWTAHNATANGTRCTPADCVALFERGRLAEVAAQWTAGVDVPWADCHASAVVRPRRVRLPGYPFQQEGIWLGRWHSDARADTEPVDAVDAVEPVVSAAPGVEPFVESGAEADLRLLGDGLALITLRAPTFTAGLLDRLHDAFAQVETDDNVRVVVLTGSESVFSMGATPEALATLAAGEASFSDVPFLYEGLLRCTRPVVCAMQGHASGGGLAFGLYADIVVMSQDADYRANFLRYGFTPGIGATFILRNRLGGALAEEMMLTGRAVRGAELARRGAGVTIVPADRVLPTALDLARSVADKPVVAVRTLKADLAARVLGELPGVIGREVAMHEQVLGADAARLVEERFATPPRPDPATPTAGPPSDEVRSAVEDVLGAVLYLQRHEIDPALTFAEMGLDSVGAVELVGQLNQRFGTDLDSVAVYNHPTVATLAEALAAAIARSQVLFDRAIRPPDAVTTAPAAGVAPISLAPLPAAPAPLPAAPARSGDAPFPPSRPEVGAIAVIGMSGRFPDAPDLETFWANLADGRSSIREVPPSRWDVATHYDPDRRVPDRTYSKWAALLDDIASFDAPFFHLSPLDAESMDPQQRLFLEEAWRAIEDAGYAGEPNGRRPWGVFVGCGAGDYSDLLADAGLAGTGQAFMGTTPSILAARVGYLLDLSGPTVAVDTACSSSLVAVDLACASLAKGDCEVAVAGGVALLTTPKMHVWTSKTGMLSPTGRSAPFDDSADGIVLGEGVGVVVLKPLARALADGDHIHSVIRATGVNGDGHTNGITAPSASAQAELIARVHERAGTNAEDIGYVEAHGTATPLGDPIEVKALTEAFRRTSRRTGFCGLGSVKGNIGHTTMSAGIAGLLKVLLALRHRQLPPSVSFVVPNSRLDLDTSPFRVVRELTEWLPGASGCRVGAVSSFGFSGTNCHVVVAEAPAATEPTDRHAAEPVVVTLSARTAAGLSHQVRRLADHLEEGVRVCDVAWTLAVGRRHLPVRAAFVASDRDELLAALRAFDGTHRAGAGGELGQLADRYVGGCDVDWVEVFCGRDHRRVPLPTYPFAGDRHWPTAPKRVLPTTLRPEDPLVADHRVGGIPVLPAAAGIQLVVSSALSTGLTAPVTVRGLRWLRPVTVEEPTTIELTVDRTENGLAIGITDGAGEFLRSTVAGEPADPETLDLAALAEQCDRLDPTDRHYADLAAAGIDYRGDYRVVESLRHGERQSLATLRPAAVLRPAVLDGAIQAAAPLVASAGAERLLPFAIECVTVHDPAATARYAHVRQDGDRRFTVRITDASGRICARLDGITLRPARPGPGTFVPDWVDAEPAAVSTVEPSRIAVLADPGDSLAHALLGRVNATSSVCLPLAEASVLLADPDRPFDVVYLLAPVEPTVPEQVTVALFRAVKELLVAGRPGRLVLVTRDVIPFGSGAPARTDTAGYLGLASAIAAEYPGWRVGCVDVDGTEPPDAVARRILGEDLARPLTVLRGDRRLVRRLVPADLPTAGRPPFRRGGTYVIVGGAGGIGLALSRHLASRYGARIGWIGRRKEDATITAARAEIERLGGRARYLGADVADAAALDRALAGIRDEFGRLHGVIHAALVLRDRTLANLGEPELLEVLSPKMAGAAALAEAVRHDGLDFLAFCSTALSFAPAPGQGNYAAASTFLDAYANALRSAGLPAVVVNWGFWGGVGAVAGREFHKRFAAIGIEPIEVEEGIAAFERVLASGVQQVLVVKGTPDGLARLGIDTGSRDSELDRTVRGYAALDEVAGYLLAERLGDRLAQLDVAADQRPLYDAVCDILARTARGAGTPDTLIATHPELGPHLTLLRRCVEALPEVLSGARRGVEVLFPRGSADGLEAVYGGNPGSDHHHRLLADGVAARAGQIASAEGRPARVLEIGAGTGAGTAFVLRACAGLDLPPDVDFTDVSTAFLTRAEARLGGTYQNLAFRALDIERDPLAQGFAEYGYDVVLAGNVLHATADLAATLANVSRLLRPGGLLLINEVTRRSDFLTLSFGLSPGWWRFTDPDRRLPHAPLLSADQWRAVVAGTGLIVRRVDGVVGQQCVLAAEAPRSTSATVADRSAVLDYVRGVFAEVLKFAPADLDDHATFDVFGVDSLVSLSIVDRFARDLGELPATLLFEQQTIDALAAHLTDIRAAQLARLLGQPPTEPEPEPGPTVQVSGPTSTGPADIAIIGVTGRYPGSPNLEIFWRNLAAGANLVTEVPADRWDWRTHFDPRRGQAQHTYSRWGGFLDGVADFDAAFFGILPRDAAAVDPQERLFLETSWTLLQDAGYLGDHTASRSTGVFVGTMYGSYGRIAAAAGWPDGRFTDGHSSYWSIANRVSYTLDLRGPSFAVDSACSSSLTALHLAVESLRRGECRMAIAGGVNLLLHPAHLVALSSLNMLAGAGECRVFDERADGFVPGEGVGAVLLKPLDAALADGDDVWAVVKGSYLNAGGRTGGYTVPNPNAQADLVVEAIRRSGIDPGTLSYIEAHGTGTALGDPIEIAGLARALRAVGASERCAVGSVKANIGHLEGAAGIAGLTKVLLQLRHGRIVPCANLERVNPKIDRSAFPLVLPTALTEWTGVRCAGVSSFGAGGANAHVVLESWQPAPTKPAPDGEQVVLLSARTPAALRTMADDLAGWIDEHPEVPLADLAYTTQVGRAELPQRLAVPAADRQGLTRCLRDVASGGSTAGAIVGTAGTRPDDEPDTAADAATLARRWVGGGSVDWRRTWLDGARQRVSLPPYPFDRRRFWLPEPSTSVTTHSLGVPEATEHRVGGRRWAPGAALLELAACAQPRISDVRWLAPWDVDEFGTEVTVSRERSGALYVRTPDGRLIARACVSAAAASESDRVDLADVRARCPRRVDIDDCYAGLRAGGIDHGPGLRPLAELHSGDGTYLARLELPDPATSGRPLHAVLVDGALQALSVIGGSAGRQLPVGVDAVTSYAALPARCFAYGREVAPDGDRRRFDVLLTDDSGRVLARLDGVTVATESAVRFLRPTWQPRQHAAQTPAPSTVLVIGDDPIADALVVRLARTGSRCVRSTATDRADWARQVAELAARGQLPDAIVRCTAPDSSVDAALLPLLWAVTAILAHPDTTGLRVVTGAVAPAPEAAALAAAMRTLALEHGRFAAATVALSGDDPDEAATVLLDEVRHLDLSAPAEERAGEVRRDHGSRWSRELEPFTPPLAPIALCPGGTYLITGGGGALGRLFARHIAEQAPVTVVLAGRSPVDDLPSVPGSRIVCEQVDVGDEGQVRTLVERIGPVHGVIHAAGVLRDALSTRKSAEDVADVLRAKVFGALHLDAATEGQPLDFIALFSSVAAWTGNLGQVDYAYANAWLDEFAELRERRRAAGDRNGRTVSICWPLWQDGGMAVGEATRALFARRWGSAPLRTGDGLLAFDRALASGESCVVVDSVSQPRPIRTITAAAGRPADLDTVRARLRHIAAGFLLVEERHVDLDADLMDTGFDSISLTELVNQVNEVYDLDLLPTVLFECATLDGFARHLVEQEQVGEPERMDTEPERVGAAPASGTPAVRSPAAPSGPEPVAVVGMAGVLPGSADLGEFWRHLVAGDDLVRQVPADRAELLADPATRQVRAGFLDDVRSFDAALFSISPREAAMMDPQQRLFLQTVWRAVEDAGYPPSALAGTATGLFAGVAACDYDDLLRAHGVPVEAHTASGVASCILANRVSHVLDLHGPSEAVDTACSSALVAVHRAVRAIQAGECDAALAGGVSVLLSPGLFVAFEKSGMLSPDGRCKSFDAGADGYGRGEGVGVVFLKPLGRAQRDGDHVYGVIRGSAVGHGGHATSLTAPNPAAQARVVVAAHREAGIDPASVGYVEAHGTGTRLGDSVEVEGLKKAFAELGADAGGEPWIAVGSVKTNIGHLEAAAGIAGLLKVLLSFQHGQLPASINVAELNPYLRLAGTPLFINDRLRPWPAGRPRRAGVSSFGFGGTNAHLVVEAVDPPARQAVPSGPHPIVLSAPSAEALAGYAARLADFLDTRPDDDLAGAAATLRSGRELMAHRVGFVALDRADAVRLLRAAAQATGDDDRLHRGVVAAGTDTAAAGAPSSPEDMVAAWVAGRPVDWTLNRPDSVRRLPGVPGFPFASTVHWFPRDDSARPSPTVESPVQQPTETPATPRPKLRLAPVNHKPPATAIVAAASPEDAESAESTGSAESTVRDLLASVLGTDARDVPDDRPFAELGLDSILRMEVVHHLNAALGTDLKAADLYEYDTVLSLSAHLGRDSTGPASDSTLRDRLERLARELTGRAVDPDRSFADNGFTSFDMLRTVSALEKHFGNLRKTLLFDRPTVDAVATELLDVFGDEACRRFADSPVLEPDGPVAAQPAALRADLPDGDPLVILKRSLPTRPDLAGLIAELDRVHAKEGGLAGRDIAPLAFLGGTREGYFNVSIRGDLLFAWSYVGTAEYFPKLAGELFRYARANGLRPNFLSLHPLTSVAGEPITATPFGAVQRLENLADFTLGGGRMSRLRYMVGRFEKAGACRTEEYRSGADPVVDQRIVDLLDQWANAKQMVNPYVAVVRAELLAGRLAERHRVFLTYLDDRLANAIIVTRIPSEPGYLMDLEFYPPKAPLGGLEYAIIKIIATLVDEGCSVFSFGASFGVDVGESVNAAPEAETALAELRSVGIFGEGNFQFKNKFRPVNVPIYLCQPVGQDRTPVSEVILMIADPSLTSDDAAPDIEQRPRDEGWRALLAECGDNPLALSNDQVGLDLVTDSWAELDGAVIRRRGHELTERCGTTDPSVPWLALRHLILTGSGRTAEALLCRSWQGRRGTVLHNGLFPTWSGALVESGFTPRFVGRAELSAPFAGDIDLVALAVLLADEAVPVSFVCLELSCNAAGGYPVSLAGLREVRRLVDQHGVPLVLDATRIVENAAFVELHEDGQRGRELWQIVHDLLAVADAATISLPKDFGVSCGGLLAVNDPAVATAAREHITARGNDITLTARKVAATALRDTATVARLARERMAAVRELWQPLHDAGLPVLDAPAGHCVLLDTLRLPSVAGYRQPVMAVLAWIFAETGIRGGPHFGDTAQLKGCIRFAVPLGVDRDQAADAGKRLAELLIGPDSPLDLVAAGNPASPSTMVYRPVAAVPDDVAAALLDNAGTADDNVAVLREHCPGVQRRLIPVGGGQVEVFVAGDGPTLLMMPPFNIGAGLFARQFAGLSDRCRVVAVHHPGVGDTSGIDDITLAGIADVAGQVLTGLGQTGPVHVAGASFGGLAALTFVLRHPDRTASLSLIGSSYKIGNRIGEVNRLDVVAREDFDALTTHAPNRFAGSRDDLERLLLRCESMDPRIGLRYLDVFAARPSLLGRLAEIAVPTLVIQGTHDSVVPVKAAHVLYGAIPGARYVELADAGHFPSLTNADEVNDLLAGMLR